MRLRGKVALVTGSTRGVGAEIAAVYAQQGAFVVVTGRTEEHGKAVVEDILASGGKAIFVRSELGSEQSVRDLVDRTIAAYGRIDVLVNNAVSNEMSRVAAKPVGETGTEEFEASMKVPVFGTFWCCKYAIPRMVAAGGGSVITISSRAATGGFPCTPGYAASKGAVNALSRQMAADYEPHGVRVNTIILGPDIADVAHLAVYLGSDESTFITAGEFTVDGVATVKAPKPAEPTEPAEPTDLAERAEAVKPAEPAEQFELETEPAAEAPVGAELSPRFPSQVLCPPQ